MTITSFSDFEAKNLFKDGDKITKEKLNRASSAIKKELNKFNGVITVISGELPPTWSAGNIYAEGDWVRYNDTNYFSNQDANHNAIPGTSSAWTISFVNSVALNGNLNDLNVGGAATVVDAINTVNSTANQAISNIGYLSMMPTENKSSVAAALTEIMNSKGQINGIASLDNSGKLFANQLPSYVDDVLEVPNFTLLPSIGESGKIYITLDNSVTYRWSGSVYTKLSGLVSASEVSVTPSGNISSTNVQSALEELDTTISNFVPTSTLNDLTDVVINTPLNNEVLKYNGTNWVNSTGFVGTGLYTNTTIIATEGQTDFSFSYSVGFVEVFVNGLKLPNVDFAATNGTSITLNAVSSGDVVDLIAYNNFDITNASDILTAVKTVDGTGSGLDADLLDGNDSTYFTNASNLDSGTVPTIRLGTGTANSTTFLRGDNTWATVGGSVSLVNDITTDGILYPIFTNATSGTVTTLNTSDVNLQYNPSTGNLSSTTFTSLSDKNMKKNIVTVNDGLGIINNINPVEFEFLNDRHSAGVIAQELEEVLPFLVNTNVEGLKSVEYNGLIPFLISAVQTLSKEVEELKLKL